ncbi:hypothetical protein D3C84_1161760 [compost metagenome]
MVGFCQHALRLLVAGEAEYGALIDVQQLPTEVIELSFEISVADFAYEFCQGVHVGVHGCCPQSVAIIFMSLVNPRALPPH